MPELKMPEVRMPDFKISGLREMSRDDIGRAFSEVHLPDVDLSSLDPRRVDLSKVERPNIDLSKIDFPKFDVARAVDTVAVAAHLRKRRSSPVRFLLGGIAVVGLAVFAVLNIPALRTRLEDVGRAVRAQVDARMGGEPSSDDAAGYSEAAFTGVPAESEAFTAAEPAPVQPDAYADSLPSATHGLDGNDDLTDGIGRDEVKNSRKS